MNYPSGETIKKLRIQKNLTQSKLAEILSVSDKTISKWETGKGLPDISILQNLSKALGVSISELFSGDIAINSNKNSNMKNLCFYVCPKCKNIIFSIGEGSFSCCGEPLKKLECKQNDPMHNIKIDFIENEYYVFLDHEMTKEHYMSMLCLVTSDRIQAVKLYPEQACCAIFSKCGHGTVYALCSNHALFAKKI